MYLKVNLYNELKLKFVDETNGYIMDFIYKIHYGKKTWGKKIYLFLNSVLLHSETIKLMAV